MNKKSKNNIKNFYKLQDKVKGLQKESIINPIKENSALIKNIIKPKKKKEKVKKSKFNKKYINYLKSAKWRKKREELFKVRGKLCERCGGDNIIQVHHITYDTLFDENLDHLEVLCKCCHIKHHRQCKKSTYQKTNKKH